MQHMRARFMVARFNGVAEDADHHAVDLLALVNLIPHQVHKPVLLLVEKDGIAHAALHDRHVKRPVDIIGRAQVVRLLDEGHILLGGDDDHGHLAHPLAFLHHVQNAQPVHLRHMDIQQDQAQIQIGRQHLKRLQAVVGIEIGVLLAEHLGENLLIQL